MSAKERIKRTLKSISNIHRPGNKRDVFIFSTPRSGSTWLMELIWTQPGFKHCNEPLNLRDPEVRQYSHFSSWEELYSGTRQQKLETYMRGFQEGRLKFKNPNPFTRYYRPITSRIVFKVIHGAEADMGWIGDRLDAHMVFLIRHPIPVTLSRKVLPRISAFLNTEYAEFFSESQLAVARRICQRGNSFEMGILSWCLQNTVPLKTIRDDWTIITYEELITDPSRAIDVLADHLKLPIPRRMHERLSTPSKVTAQSTASTAAYIRDREKRQLLVEKWLNHVSQDQINTTQYLLQLFEIEIYRADEPLPLKVEFTRPV